MVEPQKITDDNLPDMALEHRLTATPTPIPHANLRAVFLAIALLVPVGIFGSGAAIYVLESNDGEPISAVEEGDTVKVSPFLRQPRIGFGALPL